MISTYIKCTTTQIGPGGNDPPGPSGAASARRLITCRPGLRGSMKRSTESALPKTTLQWGAGMVVTAVMGFFPSNASYERICFPGGDSAERRSEEGLTNATLNPESELYCRDARQGGHG